jgi:hypothetical protein
MAAARSSTFPFVENARRPAQGAVIPVVENAAPGSARRPVIPVVENATRRVVRPGEGPLFVMNAAGRPVISTVENAVVPVAKPTGRPFIPTVENAAVGVMRPAARRTIPTVENASRGAGAGAGAGVLANGRNANRTRRNNAGRRNLAMTPNYGKLDLTTVKAQEIMGPVVVVSEALKGVKVFDSIREFKAFQTGKKSESKIYATADELPRYFVAYFYKRRYTAGSTMEIPSYMCLYDNHGQLHRFANFGLVGKIGFLAFDNESFPAPLPDETINQLKMIADSQNELYGDPYNWIPALHMRV